MRNIIKTRRYESPCGTLLLGSFEDKLCLCDWQRRDAYGIWWQIYGQENAAEVGIWFIKVHKSVLK